MHHENTLQYLIETDRVSFIAQVRAHERVSNAGCLSSYDALRNRSTWTVAGEVVGESEGPVGTQGRYWAVVALTKAQHGLATDQLSNNDVSDDVDLIEHFWREGRITSATAKSLLLERPRCLREPLYEPLQLRREVSQ